MSQALDNLRLLLQEWSLPLIERVRFDGKSDHGIEIRVRARTSRFRPLMLTSPDCPAEIVVDVSAKEPRFVMGRLILINTEEARGLLYPYLFVPGDPAILAEIYFAGESPLCNIEELRFYHDSERIRCSSGLTRFENPCFRPLAEIRTRI